MQTPAVSDKPLWVLLGCSFGFKVLLVHIFPAVYGGDPIGRLLHKDSLFFSYWLPGLQAIIFIVTRITGELPILRCFIILISTLTGLALHCMVRNMADREVSLYATAFFLFSPLSVFLSLVPYQEMLFGALSFASLHFFFSMHAQRRFLIASLFLAAACLTRYEAWLLAAMLSVIYVKDNLKSKRSSQTLFTHLFETIFTLVRGILLFAWAPLALLAAGMYTSPQQNAALISPLAIATSPRYLVFIVQKSIEWSNPILAVLVLAAGIRGKGWQFVETRLVNSRAARTFLAFVALFMVFLLFCVADPTRYNQRFMFLSSTVVCILAGFSVSFLKHTMNVSFHKHVLFIGLVLALLIPPILTISRATEAAGVRIPFEIAGYLNNHMQQSERAVVLEKLQEGFPHIAPPEYGRIAIQTLNGTVRILSANEFLSETNPDSIIRGRNIRYLIEFENFNQERYLGTFQEYIRNNPTTLREVARWEKVRVLQVVFREVK